MSFSEGFKKVATEYHFEHGPHGEYIQHGPRPPRATLSGLIGLMSGFSGGTAAGRSAAGNTANLLSKPGTKTQNEEIARNIARVTAPVGAVAGLALGYKHKDKLFKQLTRLSDHPEISTLYHGIIPAASGIAGGMAGGAVTGLLTSARGHLFAKPKKKAE